jgi:RNA recognition motif-containing protein
VVVGNLAWDVTDERIAELLQPYGALSCRLMRNRPGMPRGFALAQFSSAADAARAVEGLDNSTMDDRLIEVQ